MKKLLAVALLLPSLSYANLYECAGSGFIIDVNGAPLEMKISGNGFDAKIGNLRAAATFDTTIVGNSANPAATIKLVIKDSSYANPGDSFKSILTISSPAGVKEYAGLICIRGND
jgi:hypothetical protein